MYIDNNVEFEDVCTVLSNLCDKAKKALKAVYGRSFICRAANEIIKAEEKKLIRLKETNEIVGVFGLTYQGHKIGGIFFLTTDNLHKGNIITLLRGAKRQIARWEKNYRLLLDNCHDNNQEIKKWLKILGFKPSHLRNGNFQIYYKGNINLYNPQRLIGKIYGY